jgi:Zn-dependent protease
MLPRASLRLGRIGSIDINVNVTWLVILGLLIYWLRTGYIAQNAPAMGALSSWLASAVGALALFASVLAHELAHSLVAVRNGLPIRRITLFIFGGIAHMESEPRTPGVELRMAVAGPLASLAIAGILGFTRFVVLKGSDGAAALILQYATYANLVLACFNLVPGFPLDGGRMLRALVWRTTRDLVKATAIAAGIGRGFGLLLVFLGVVMAVAWELPGFLWLVLIGTFLERLAYLSIARVRMMAGITERIPAGAESHTPHGGWYRGEA